MLKQKVESLNCYRISVATIYDIHSVLVSARTKPIEGHSGDYGTRGYYNHDGHI